LNATHKALISSDELLPRIYSLPEIHKLNCPFKIIVSFVDSPLYALDTFLQKIISTNIPLSASHIGNSFDLVEKLINIYIDEDFSLISLNVVSLFTNIPIDLTIKSLTDRWNFFSVCNIPKNEFFAVCFVLESTYFSLIIKFTSKSLELPWAFRFHP